ncbi:hypothetical protein [Spirosoma sordidisoli]|uniref:Uncharacterized protein n=1 Tax=Spirosoma sordidisoli TaxID=2502893 RepID=A0A4V1RWF6_9BACT|nr:hypothetical protein [Spirosoma sordidisoli]RYC70098.1 hypothetical protein EQG79_09510 [Spirosoma sordidisoli]
MTPTLTNHIAQRFTEVFQALDVNANEVAHRLGVANVKWYKILKGETKPSYETLDDFLKAYPRVNANYLLKGQLPILHTSGAEIVGTDYEPATQISLPMYVVGSGKEYVREPEQYVSIVAEEQTDYTSSMVVRLTDNSMQPRYPAGMRLLAKPIPVADWDYINSTLVLVLYRNTLVVRRIKENELLSRHYLTLYADSDEAGFVIVKREDVKSIWRITKIIGGEID